MLLLWLLRMLVHKLSLLLWLLRERQECAT